MANVLSMAKKIAVITALGRGLLRSLHFADDWRFQRHDPSFARDGRQSLPGVPRPTLRNIPAKRVQVDEIWTFCYAKQKNVTPEMWDRVGYAGDVWTFTAIDAETKLVISWLVGRRDAGCAADFLQDVAGRLANRIQLTTDGHRMYLIAVPDAFGDEIDYAQLVKSTATILRDRSATAPRNVWAPNASKSSAIRIPSTSPPAMWSGRTSTCG